MVYKYQNHTKKAQSNSLKSLFLLALTSTFFILLYTNLFSSCSSHAFVYQDNMDSDPCQLHIAFFPFLAPGHMIPLVDMARLFARKGVKATIVTTPLNAVPFSRTVERESVSGSDISILTIKFPAAEVGLPEDCENANFITNKEMLPLFYKATFLLQQPIEKLIEELFPDCLVADMMYPWATESAAKFGIPRLLFHGFSAFSLCLFDCFYKYEPHTTVESDTELFLVPGLPDRIEFTRLQVPPFLKEKNETAMLGKEIFQSDKKCYGVFLNSLHELEPAYSEYYRKVMGIKAWQIGPLSLCNKENEDKAQRGFETSIDEHECLSWLASRKPNSVLYLCFGSLFHISAAQSLEIAEALESCGHNFIWVVRNIGKEAIPEGFEKRVEGRGLIIRGWAPQVLILDHEAVGGFMTHCGWNSILEGIAAGLSMVTWPRHSEQFFNEKLVTDVREIGTGVGAQEWTRYESKILVKKEEIENAVNQVMAGEEAEGFRNRAKALKKMAAKAIEKGGSSSNDMDAFLEELRTIKASQ